MATPYVGTPIIGPASTSNVNATDIIPEIERRVTLHDRDSSPIITFFTTGQTRSTEALRAPDFSWYEDQFDYPQASNVGAIAAVAANTPQTVTFDMPNAIVGQNFYHVQTNQTFTVQAVANVTPTTADLTILKLPTTSATTAIAASGTLVSTGVFMPEGGRYPTPRGTKPTRLFNNVQLVTRSIGITRTEMATDMYYGSQFEYDKAQNITQFKSDMERVALFGQQFTQPGFSQNNGSSVSVGTLRGSLGVYPRVTTNVATYAGTLTESIFDSYLNNQVWGSRNSGSRIKLSLIGPDAMTDLDSFVKQKVRVLDQASARYGINISTYVTRFGNQVMFLPEREFWESGTNLRSTILTLDPKFISIMYMQANLIQIIADTQPTDSDSYQVTLRSEMGMKVRFEQAHSRLSH